MSDSDDTDVLLLIPNDFFAVDEPESQERLQSSNLISFSSMKMTDSRVMDCPQEAGRGPSDHCNMEFSLNPTQDAFLQEIDSYLKQINVLQPQQKQAISSNPPMYCESTISEIPSLKDLWHAEGSSNSHSKAILEERLRRRHLEKDLEATQLELIEAQQKVSVALSVDRAKDVAIGKLRNAIKVIQEQANATEGELQGKIRELEVELKNSLDRSKRLMETNQVLEGKVAHLTTATNDIREVNKKQIDDLQIRLSNSLKAEQLINDDLVRTRNQWVIEKNCHRENQEAWARKEALYKGEQETLRASLKHYYQKQLNDVVGEKLKEFQSQMDELETQFKMEYLRRERQIAERAIQQIELIYKKNEEEVRLLTEKHHEEIKFVQLQLEMAQATISEAQQRLMGTGGGGQLKREPVDVNETQRTAKKVNISPVKTPMKRNNYCKSPELQSYMETLLKKSPKFNSTRLNTPLKR